MKNIILGFLILSICISCKKDKNEPKIPESEPTYYTFEGEIDMNSSIISSDNNLIFCGRNGNSIAIIKSSLSGALINRNDFYIDVNSYANGIVEMSNQDLLLCGTTKINELVSKKDILLIKANSNGDTLWTKTLGSVDDDYGYQIIRTNDDNYLICGNTYGDSASFYGDIFLIKINSDGDTIWSQTYPDPEQEVPLHLMETQNGEILVTGTNEDSSNPRGLYLLKTDASGNKIWDQTIGAGLMKWGYSSIELPNGNLLTCGQTSVNGITQLLILKTDNLGNVIWEKEIGVPDVSESGIAVKQNNDGTFIITGSENDEMTMQSDIIVLKIDQSGNQVWYKRFGSSQWDYGLNLLKDGNDINIITGDYDGKIFMTKMDNNGVFQ